MGLVTAVLLLPVVGCSDDEPEEGAGRLEIDDGAALVVRQDGEREEIDDDTDVRTGDTVTLRDGSGRLELRGGTVLELRAGTGDEPDTSLVMGPVPVLEEGDLLVEAAERFALAAGDTDLELAGGAARISRAIVLEVASYDAAVHLDSAGQEREIPALREMQIPAAGLPPEQARPFEYEPEDPWDRRFLRDAIELGQRLQAIGDGYTANLDDGDGRTVAFFRGVLPGLVDEVDLTSTLLGRGRPPGETLVGAAIADLGRRGTFAERWQAVFAFRDAGADWGLVALDQGVDRGSLLDALTDAVESTELAIGPGPTAGRAPGRGATGGGVDGGGAPATTPTTRPGRTPPTTRPPSPPPVQEEDKGLLPPLLGPIVDPVTELLSGLVDGLLGGLFTASGRS